MTYSYNAVGNLQSYSYPNTVTTSYAYNNLNRLTTLSVANGQTNLASYAYTLGASGNRTQVVENNGRTVNYAYDDLYRLTSETIANGANNGSISYSFDTVGNRLQRNSNVNLVANQTSIYDANDRINSDTFDNNGSTKVSNGKSYNYDFENHLTSTSDGITVVYDGDGNRISKTVNGLTTKYLVDTNNLTGYAQVVEELQNGSVSKQYTYGLDLISQRQSSGVSFYNYDGHGSVRGLSNASGNVTDTYSYDAFGTLIERTGTTDNNYLYSGEQFDGDLGFYYNRARYLNVSTGRFISQDSYEGNYNHPKSLHKYSYAENDAVNAADPSGNFTISEIVAVASIIVVLSIVSYDYSRSYRGVAKSYGYAANLGSLSNSANLIATTYRNDVIDEVSRNPGFPGSFGNKVWAATSLLSSLKLRESSYGKDCIRWAEWTSATVDRYKTKFAGMRIDDQWSSVPYHNFVNVIISESDGTKTDLVFDPWINAETPVYKTPEYEKFRGYRIKHEAFGLTDVPHHVSSGSYVEVN
jgi:RHS repeat-associated protein